MNSFALVVCGGYVVPKLPVIFGHELLLRRRGRKRRKKGSRVISGG